MTSERNRRLSKAVLLIHGMDSDGAWYKDVEPILRPHFEPFGVHYEQYRTRGELFLLMEAMGWLVIVFTPLIIIFGALIAAIHGRLASPASYMVLLIITLIWWRFGPLLVRRYRMGAINRVVGQVSPHMVDKRPHIIAHSLGGYFTASLLKRYGWAWADRIVFAGCAVKHDFDWHGLWKHQPTKFRHVRNDFTQKDPIIRMTRLIEWAIPEFGRAGLTGFEGTPQVIRNFEHPTRSWPAAVQGSHTLIDNVDCTGWGDPSSDFSDHSLTFLTAAHAGRFWLPYLWGIDPAEYYKLLTVCEGARSAEEIDDEPELVKAEDELLDTCWVWADKGNQPFKVYLDTLLERKRDRWQGRSKEELLGRVVREFWMIIERARTTRQLIMRGDKITAEENDQMLDLHPRRAISTAIREVLSSI